MFCPFAIDIVFYLFVNQGISVYSGVPVVLGDVKMIFEEKKITLKNGLHATLETPKISDAAQLIDLMATVSDETPFLTRYKEEWEGVSVEGEENWIKSVRESQNSFVLICRVNGEIAGVCDVTFKTGMKTCHRATVGIGLRKKYWNLGIGSAMFKELINTATEHGGIDFMELEFTKGNERAKVLYEKFGFKVACEKPKFYKLKDGTYQALVYMQKYL